MLSQPVIPAMTDRGLPPEAVIPVMTDRGLPPEAKLPAMTYRGPVANVQIPAASQGESKGTAEEAGGSFLGGGTCR